MPATRFGFVTAAHVHFGAFYHALRVNPCAEIAGIWDHDEERGRRTAEQTEMKLFESLNSLLESCNAVVVISETTMHVKHCAAAAAKGKHILCEKPLVTNEVQADALRKALDGAGVKFMTAFPCRYSPAFLRLRERVAAGDIGKIQAICSTNRGNNPGGWFAVEEFSGGGAMMDHTVHLADLLWLLLGEEPLTVEAQTGTNVNKLDVDDTAILTLQYPSGIFATIDASWSRPKKYKTWGDLTMNVVGSAGVIEMDLFGQQIQVFDAGEPSHTTRGFGSEEYPRLVDDFIRCIVEDREPPITLEDGLRASRVTHAAYANCSAGSRAAKG